MAVRLTQPEAGLYFITFTCFEWKPLIELTNSYNAVYKFFDYLYTKGGSVSGYVIMPNHVHALVSIPSSLKSINTVIGNAKRFIAYNIIETLEAQKAEDLLQELHGAVSKREQLKGQRNKVFEESFDAKLCHSPEFILQKLDYMHYNPVRGKWNLAGDFALYPHSSAGFYHGTDAHAYKRIVHVGELAG